MLCSVLRYKVEHGCTIATIGGARGILVVGGATGEDLVEFMDWEDQTQWTVLGKMNRGRSMAQNISKILLCDICLKVDVTICFMLLHKNAEISLKLAFYSQYHYYTILLN